MADEYDFRQHDPETDAFVSMNVVSFAAWDLLVYLNHHPEIEADDSKFAKLLGRQSADVVHALEHLQSTGVLMRAGDGKDPVYRLADDESMRDLLARFVALTTEKEWRFELVRRVLATYGRR